LTNDAVLKFLESQGIKVASLEDLKKPAPAPDPAKEAEDREAAELAYALSKGLFNRKDYDSYVADSKDAQNFVYAQYHAEAKADDAELTDEEIHEEFQAKYGLDAEPGSRKHKRGVKEINTLAENFLRQKYGKIYDAKSAFTNYEKESSAAKDNETKFAAGSAAYDKDINDVFTDLKKIPIQFSDKDSYEVALLDEHLDELKAAFLKPDHKKAKILSGYKKETLKQEAWAAFLFKNFPYLAREVANQHMSKHAAGTRGIPPITGGGKKDGDAPVLTEAQKTLIELNRQAKEKEAATAN
jgi:hypothetical protein